MLQIRPAGGAQETTRVGRASLSHSVLHSRALTLTLLDHTPFHEDETEDDKQEAGLRVGGIPVHTWIQINEGSPQYKHARAKNTPDDKPKSTTTHLMGGSSSSTSSLLTSM